MKTPALLFAVLCAAATAALVQSASPAAQPNYYGTANSSAVDTSAGQPGVTATEETKSPANPAATAASEGAGMKKVAELLKTAKEKLQSTKSTTPKADALPFVEAARDALKQQTTGDGRYKGHRAKAQKNIHDTIVALKAGDKDNRAAGGLTESISEIFACQGLVK